MKEYEGIIKINPYRFRPIIQYVDGTKWSWDKKVDNVMSVDVSSKQINYAFNHINNKVTFYINNKDFGIIK